MAWWAVAGGAQRYCMGSIRERTGAVELTCRQACCAGRIGRGRGNAKATLKLFSDKKNNSRAGHDHAIYHTPLGTAREINNKVHKCERASKDVAGRDGTLSYATTASPQCPKGHNPDSPLTKVSCRHLVPFKNSLHTACTQHASFPSLPTLVIFLMFLLLLRWYNISI
jgi:hypothetical protein